MTNDIHEANRKGWDAVAAAGRGQVDSSRTCGECFEDATRFFEPQERAWLEDVSQKRVCVLGSGDNLAVFALAGMGARVTSVDISEEQLCIARERAADLGADIEFVRADVTDLRAIADGTFDIVYTGGHVAVWVSDLEAYYREAVRILVPGGLIIVTEYHPFRRLVAERPGPPDLEFGYFERGPHEYDRADDVPGATGGSLPSFEFHWTVSDYLNAVRNAPAEILDVAEFGEEGESWEIADLSYLPRCLMIVGRKK
jgi:SAM-dependent methyltransferase